MSHTVDTTTTDYFWDIARSLPVVLQDGTNTYVYGLDLISATDGSGAQTYFTYDGLGSTTDLTDASGNTLATYSYDVFGAIRSQTGGGSNFWLFTGEQRDSDSALYFLRARYYDPNTGRFLGKDPLNIGNRYSYVSNNPVNLVDPLGLCGWGDPWNCGDEAVDVVVDAIPRMSTVISWVDVVPLTPLSWEFTAAFFTQMTILLSECSTSDMIGLSLLNGANLVIGVGGTYVTWAATSTTIVGGVIVAAEVAVVEASIVAATNEGLAKCNGSGGSVTVVPASAAATRTGGAGPGTPRGKE